MNYFAPSLFYFPTTVLFVDDDPAYLSNIGFEIDNKIPLLTCDRPRDVPQILKERSDVTDLVTKLMGSIELKASACSADEISSQEISHLYKNSYNLNRFNKISVLVVDYSMPGLNGAELCEQLKDNPVKKIMLTGAADYQIAVELFNSKLIDFFIVKDNPNMAVQLNKTLQEAQQNYFHEASSSIIRSLTSGLSYLTEPAFTLYFSDFIQKHHISEYYWIHHASSFLMIDFWGKAFWMTIFSEKEFESYFNIAIDNEAPMDVISSLEQRKKILFLLTEKHHKATVMDWEQYLHLAQPIPNLNGYFSAIIPDDKVNYLSDNKILSHKLFIDKKCVIC